MVDREETIHVKIKIDIADEDKQFVESLASQMEEADETKSTKADPRNLPKKRKDQEKDPEEILKEIKAKEDRRLLKEFKEGPVGMVNDFTTSQANNLRSFVSSPAQFLIAGITKKMGKYGVAFGKAGFIGLLGLLVYETVLFVFDQLMQPGRPLDRRFKRIAQLETLKFYERTLQEEIRHGYQEIRITTRAGLRGGAGQVNGNFFEFSGAGMGVLQGGPYRSSIDLYRNNAASGSVVNRRGAPRKSYVARRNG